MQLFGPDKSKLGLLKNYKDYCIESVLSTGDKTLSILHPASISKNIVEEGYIQNKTNEYVIKEIVTQGNWKRVKAKLNVEDLEGKVFESFETVAETITDCINLALAGTGWVVGSCDVTKRRTVRKTNSSSWDIIQEAKKVYRCELEFDTLKKKINIFEKRGADKGVYFIDTLNLKNLDVQSDSYDYYTRIIAKGKGDLKVTLENFQYSSKVKTYIWKDERYTDIDSLTEDARAKLNDLSKPYRSYKATIIDLANISKENYKNILSYSLGDIITLVSKENRIREKQRIVKIVEYPDEPQRNTCEMANTILTFEDIQKELQETSNTVNNITTDDGTIDGSSINSITTKQISDFEASIGEITDLTVVNARIDELYAKKANVGELNAVVVNVAELYATKATITELNALSANINTALIGKADITELNALNATIKVLEVDTAAIKTLVNGNLSSENIQAGGITSDKLTIANGFITNAMIASLDVSKINAGTISTNKFRIVSDNGGIEIVGATQQFKDKNNKVRIQMGQDTQGNFNFILRGEDGTTTLIDHTGIKERAIADNLIKENMVAADAIGEKQINYSSLITGLNKDTNTQLIKASKVAIDFVGQSLEVAFNSLKSNVDSKETRNLFIKKNSVDGIYNDNNFVESTNYKTSDYIEVTEGEIYTLCKFSTDGYHRIIAFDEDKNRLGNRLVKQDNILKYVVPINVKYIRISIEKEIIKYKIERYENPNPVWTSAPEDIDSLIESNSTTINVMQGQIATAINNTKIVKDGQTILLKDDYNRTVSKVDSINSTIGTHTTKLDQLTGNITNVDTKVNNVQRDLDGTKSTVSSHTSQINGLNSTVNTQGSSINQLKNQIALKVEQTDINNAMDNMQIGGRNLLPKKSLKLNGTTGTLDTNTNIWTLTAPKGSSSNGVGLTIKSPNNIIIPFGKSIMYSFDIKVPKQINWNFDINNTPVGVDAWKGNDNDNIAERKYSSNTITKINEWVKCWVYAENTSSSNTNKVDIKDSNSHFRIVTTNETTDIKFYIRNFKVEYGNKATDWSPAPEDVDSAISTVDSKVTTTNNKVATIETNLNSITSRVSSTESTVSTHTTQLGTVDNRINTAKNSAINTAASDATTKANNAVNSAKTYTDGQIKTVNQTITNKVAEIKTTTDSITQKVSSTDSKITTINNNITSLQNRMNSAESKITDSAIINTVKSTINTAKTEAINSANSSTDNKLKNYATTSSLTQTATNIKAEFKSTGGYNLIANSTGYNGINLWTLSGGTLSTSTNNSLRSSTNMLIYLDNGTKTTQSCAFSKRFKLKANTKYTLSGWFHNYTKCPSFDVFVLSSTEVPVSDTGTSYTNTNKLVDNQTTLGSWKKFSVTFTTDSDIISGYVRIDNNGYNPDGSGNNRIHWSALMLNEGEEQPWTPHPDEVYNGSTIIDATGVTVNNGALRVKNKAGTTVLEGDSNGNLTMKNGCFKLLASNNMEIASINQNNWMRIQGIEIFGNGECMQNKGGGARSLKIISTSADSTYIDFDINTSPTVSNQVRLIRESSSMSLKLFGHGMTFMPRTSNTACGLEVRSQSNTAYIDFTTNQSDDYHSRLYLKNNNSYLYTAGPGLVVNGSLSVSGSKNCLQSTENYDERLINAYETAECYYGDLGFGKINNDGECIVYIDDVFSECVNTNIKYHVFTQIYNGVIENIERYKTYFLVKGYPGTNFSWELKAKRIKHENVRLDMLDIDNKTSNNLKMFSDDELSSETPEDVLLDILTFDLENILMEG